MTIPDDKHDSDDDTAEASFRRSWRESQAGVVYPIEDPGIGPDDPMPRTSYGKRLIDAKVEYVAPRFSWSADDPAENQEDAMGEDLGKDALEQYAWEVGPDDPLPGNPERIRLVSAKVIHVPPQPRMLEPADEDRTCKTCRHWRRHQKESHLFGQCRSDKLIGRTNREASAISFCGKPEDEHADILLYDDSNYYAAVLETGQDFGCIHWEPSTNTSPPTA